MTSHSQSVLQVGATGYTGQSVAKALMASGEFVVKALVRPSSLSKPQTKQLEALGVEIIPGDMTTSEPEALDKALQGVDIVISTVLLSVDQKPLLLAAKRAGVKRVVPSEFGPAIPRGEFFITDLKYAIRDFIIENEIPYTFIQVGWWTNLMLPYPQDVKVPPTDYPGKEMLGPGDVKVAHTAYDSLGEFTKRIIADPRTLNETVQTYDGELTLEEAWALGARISGENFDDYTRISAAEIEERLARMTPDDIVSRGFYGYARVLFVRGDNTVKNAIKDGALDARELYPDYQPPSLEELAKEFYRSPPKRKVRPSKR